MKASLRTHSDGPIADSELILNPDGSIYHLGIRPEHLSDTIIIVGDPERVGEIAGRFDHSHFDMQNREFRTCKGELGGIDITIVSTGIGVDNVDIVMNELDALANIDFATRLVKTEQRSMRMIRLGTSGTIRPEIDTGSHVASRYAFALDGVPYSYRPTLNETEEKIQQSIGSHLGLPTHMPVPYVTECESSLLSLLGPDVIQGITMTANGFYGPQGRALRLNLRDDNFHDQLRGFRWNEWKVTNIEMECAGLYSLGSMLGHQMLTVCAILANRATGAFSKTPQKDINNLIDSMLERLTQSL